MARGTTTSITVRYLVELLDEAGVAADDLLATAGLDRSRLGAPDLRMPLAPFDALWARVAQRQPEVGLRLIDRFGDGRMHIVAHLALRSATVGEALRAVATYMHHTDVNDGIDLEPAGQQFVVIYRNVALDSGQRHNPWVVEHLLAMACVLLERACGRRLPVRSVTLRAARQAPLPAYLSRFGVTPQFGARRNALAFDAEALDWPLQTHDTYLRAILERVVQAQLPPPDALVPRVRDALRRAWMLGTEPTRAGIAAACGLSEQSLRRQLEQQQEPLSFRQLKDESRRDLAQAHFAGPLSNGEIAYLLGFSEPAALQHACRRWFGRPLGEMRRARRG